MLVFQESTMFNLCLDDSEQTTPMCKICLLCYIQATGHHSFNIPNILVPALCLISQLVNGKTIHSQSITASHTCQCDKWEGWGEDTSGCFISGGDTAGWVRPRQKGLREESVRLERKKMLRSHMLNLQRVSSATFCFQNAWTPTTTSHFEDSRSKKKGCQKKLQASALSANFLHRPLSGGLSLLNKKQRK